MNTRPYSLRLLVICAVCSAAAISHVVQAQKNQETTNSFCPTSFSWMLKYASPTLDRSSRNSVLLDKPCFKQAMQHAFGHSPSFMGADEPISKMAALFLQVQSNGPVSGNDRFIRLNGCVPHDCPTTGMIWIDTKGTQQIVFTASSETLPIGKQTLFVRHLWLYTSTPIDDVTALPSPLIDSIEDTYQYQTFSSATIVQPDGEMIAVSPETLHLRPIDLPATK
jgi:hypothetical protein